MNLDSLQVVLYCILFYCTVLYCIVLKIQYNTIELVTSRGLMTVTVAFTINESNNSLLAS